MTGTTHLAAGAALGLFISSQYNLSLSYTLAVTTCTAAGSLIPDIDSMTSTLGRRSGLTSVLIQLFIGHRTLFHAPILYIALTLMVAGIYPPGRLLILAVAAGIGSHLLLDMCNGPGIPLFWPLNIRVSLAKFRTGGVMDRLLCVIFWILSGLTISARL